MVIGILPDAATTETLLNNLAEAEFDLADVSVVMRDCKQRDTIADDAGPLRGALPDRLAEHLTRAGLTTIETTGYVEAVRHDQVLVAIATTPLTTAAAREMLSDHTAQLITGVS
jgi:hypothetical protein